MAEYEVFSACKAARGRNIRIKQRQGNLQRSLIERTVSRFVSSSQPFGFTIGTVPRLWKGIERRAAASLNPLAILFAFSRNRAEPSSSCSRQRIPVERADFPSATRFGCERSIMSRRRQPPQAAKPPPIIFPNAQRSGFTP